MTATRVKVAIVAGSRGIGREIAERLARDGYDLALASSAPEARINPDSRRIQDAATALDGGVTAANF
jgi:NAD(P)-dependent dehydrogenase (short-subunit alcohol dehydrogenase family)